MNITQSIANFTKLAIIITTASFAVNAAAADTSQSPMQRYVFKYNFHKDQDLVSKMINETQQYVRYEVAVDVLNMAHHSIRKMGEDVSYVAVVSAKHNTEQNTSLSLAE